MIEPAKYLTAKLGMLALAVAAALVITGCQTRSHFASLTELGSSSTNIIHAESLVLREGDQLKVTFPGAPNLNSPPQPIRRDGNISLPLVGDVRAVGKTPAQLQEDLIKLYAGQVESKQILVEVASSTFPVFVQGAVLKPGKVLSDHPMSALEAVSECGGFDFNKANLKKVEILRQEGTRVKNYKVNLKEQMKDGAEQFYLQPGDIIYVREKFVLF